MTAEPAQGQASRGSAALQSSPAGGIGAQSQGDGAGAPAEAAPGAAPSDDAAASPSDGDGFVVVGPEGAFGGRRA